MNRILLISGILMMLLAGQVFAQEKVVTGKVTSHEDGSDLPGVNVTIKGSTQGTTTDASGTYKLTVPENATLLFSFIGLLPQEVSVGNRSVVDVKLRADVKQLDEVVVTGLATSVKRSNLANAVTTVSAEQLVGTTRPVTMDAALSGKVVGANIVQNSGAPGGGISMQLRGISSIAGNSQPLFIIDGVYLNNQQYVSGRSSDAFNGAGSSSLGAVSGSQDNSTNRISDINPADIETIEILKGPSAAAIYGTLANAGVVIITTKKGKSGKTHVSFAQDVGFVSAIKLLGSSNWTPEKINQFYGPGDRANQEIQLLNQATATGKIYDYEKEIFGNVGLIKNTRVNISGGNEKTNFFLSGGLNNEDGIVKNTGFQRNSIRANVNHKISKWWDISSSSNYINSSNRRGFEGNDNNGVNIAYNLSFLPNYAQLHPDANGVYPINPYYGENPLAIINKAINKEMTNRFIQAFTTNVYLLQDAKNTLKLSAQGGLDYTNTETILFAPPDLQSQVNNSSGLPGASRYGKNQTINTNMQAFLVYNQNRGKFNLTTSLGAVRLTTNNDLSYIQGQGMPAGTTNPATASVQTIGAYFSNWQNVGMVAQQELNYNDQFVGTVGIRFDKTTLNGMSSRYYPFLKASLATNLTKFNFWNADQINMLKLRVAYGQTGGVANFGNLYTPLNSVTYDKQLGIQAPTALGNPNIKYENATELEYGFDMSMLDNRVTLEASAYDKKVFNLIQPYSLASSTGYTAISAYPVGDLSNKGMEVSLGITPVKTKNFDWTFTTQYWFNRSKITRLAIPVTTVGSGFGVGTGANELAVGVSPTAWVGTPYVTDANGQQHLTVYGNAQPNFQMSFSNQMVIYKNFQFSFLLYWRDGGYNVNFTQSNKDQGGTSKDWSVPSTVDAQGQPLGTNPDGTPITMPLGQARLINQTAANYIEKAGFVRLREIALYYTIPKAVFGNFGNAIQKVRVGVSANNLLTFTKYKGYDPEVSNFGTASVGAQQDLQSYPNTKRIFMHLAVDF